MRDLPRERQDALTRLHQTVREHEDKLLQAYSVLEDARATSETIEDKRRIGSIRRSVSTLLKRLRKLELAIERDREKAIQERKAAKLREFYGPHSFLREPVEQGDLGELAAKERLLGERDDGTGD